MPKDKKELPPLDDKQKQFIRENWQMDQREMCQKTWGNPSLTLRHVECKSCRAYLAEIGRDGEAPDDATETGIELAADDVQYISNNVRISSPLEITRTIFGDQKLTLTSPQGRAVLALCKKLAPDLFNRNDEPVEDFEYKPPRTLKQLVEKIDRLVPNPAGLGIPLYNLNELNSQQQKNLNVLLACLNIPRFIHQASQYLKKVDRELFESSFMRQIHNLTDLGEADVDQYIAYCSSIVSSAQTDRTIQRLQGQVDDEFESNRKVSMTLVEHLKTLNSNLQDEKKRQEALYKTLSGARSVRLNDLTQASQSMHPLVEKWRTKEGRMRLLAGAAVKRDALGKEVRRLTEMEALRSEIWGLSPDSIQL